MSTAANQITHPPLAIPEVNPVKRPNRLAAIGNLTPEQRSLLTLLLRERSTPRQAEKIERVSRDQELPTSVGQEARLNWERFARDHKRSIKPFQSTVGFRIAGTLDTEALQSAIREIVRRHEVFRTSFHDLGEKFVQVINPAAMLMFGIADFQHLPAVEQEKAVSVLAQDEVRHPFDLTRDVLLRATLLYLSPNEHALILTTSHMIFDGWSQILLLKELRDFYVKFSNGEDVPTSEPLVQFADFTDWQRRYLQGPAFDKLVTYWKRQLHGMEIVPVMELPFERPLPAASGYEAKFLSHEVPAELLQSLKDFSRRNRVTMFMLLLTAVKVLMRCYTGKDDIGLISVVANRNRPETETVIGYFANLIVLRTDLSGNPKFSDALQSVRKVVIEAHSHQDLPFPDLLKAVNGGNRARKPYILFNMTPADQGEAVEIPGLTCVPLPIIEPPQAAEPGLEFHVSQSVDGMTVRMTYELERFDAATAAQILRDLLSLLEKIVTDPDQHLSELSCAIENSRLSTAYPLKQSV